MRRFLFGAGVAGALLVSQVGSGQAAVIIDAVESGGNVVFTYSGSIDLTGLGAPNINGNANPVSGVAPTVGAVGIGNGNAMDAWFGSYDFPAFGPGFGGTADSAAGPGFTVYHGGFGIFDGYVSGNPISGSMTFLGDTFASLGMTPGSYVATLPSDTITLNIGVVPEPASLTLLGAGVLGLAAARRRRAS